MKNDGFTLIELLAVIVVLAIIVLIAYPIIKNVIEKAKKQSAVNSALGYLDAVEKYAIMHDLDSTRYVYDLKNKTLFIAKENESIENKSLNEIISVKGNKPSGEESFVKLNEKGKVEVLDGNAAEMIIAGYNVTCESSTKCTAGSKATEEKVPNASEIGITINEEETNVEEALNTLYERIGEE